MLKELTPKILEKNGWKLVLILILMEHAQRDAEIKASIDAAVAVLILILMEHAQRAKNGKSKHETRHSLNPYFNGTCSKRARRYTKWRQVWLS